MVFEHLVGAVQVGTAGPIKQEATVQIHQNKSLAQPIGLALFVFFGAFVLSAFASHSFAPVGDSSAVESEVNIEIEPSLSLAIMDKDPSNLSNGEVASTIDTMSMEVTPNASGVFINSTAYVVAGSNNETGYTLSFSDTDDNTALINTDPTVTTNIPSISSASSSLTDIATNQWGYAFGDSASISSNPTGLTNTSLATSFNPVPALSSPAELAKTVVPASHVYPFTTASKLDMNVVAGTYQDSVVFSLVANFVPKTDIVFNANQASYNPSTAVSGTMNGVDLDYNKKVVLPTNEYTRLGYRFLGWDTDGSVTTPTYSDGDTIDYHTVNGSNTTSSTLTLYAIWQPKNFPTTLTTMQGMTSDICADVYTPTANSTTIEALDQTNGSNYYYSADNVAQSTLSDIRDSNTYVVRKLADGNCWMVQNLNLNLSTSVSLNSTTSDLTEGRTWTPNSTTQTSVQNNMSWPQDSGNLARSYNPGNIYYSNGYGTGAMDSSYNYPGYQTTGEPWYHIGNYYNWYAATAGTGTAAMTDGSATDSICPKNWKLPNYSEDKSWANLIIDVMGLTDNLAGAQRVLRSPLHFVQAGYALDGLGWPSAQGQVGYYWTNAIHSFDGTVSTARYMLFSVDNSRLAPMGRYKGDGLGIRCLAR